MPIEFDLMKGKAKTLYRAMWENCNFPNLGTLVEKTPWRGGVSNQSYCFSLGKAERCERLMDIFSVRERELFTQKYREACSGSGQEERKIATMHSSSLCALLFFYGVAEENPLTLTLSGNDYRFTESHFEFQNPVFGTPSNMDVVLLGEECTTHRAVVLFLESKFSEYYLSAGAHLSGIRNVYLTADESKGIYQRIHALGCDIDSGESEFALSADEPVYLGGIKQMISHLVGVKHRVCNLPTTNGGRTDEKQVNNMIASGAQVLLGEILFDRTVGDLPLSSGKPCLAAYEAKYRKLAKVMNDDLTATGFQNTAVLPQSIGYSEIVQSGYSLEPKVLEYYGFQ